MKTVMRIVTPEVTAASSAHIVLDDPEHRVPVVEISIRGAGYVQLTEDERLTIAQGIFEACSVITDGYFSVPDREGGYVGEPPLWETAAAEQAAKRAAQSGGGGGSGKVKVPKSPAEIVIPTGATFDADGLVVVPSRKGETAEGKQFRRACRKARRQQIAMRDGQPVEAEPADAETGDDYLEDIMNRSSGEEAGDAED